MKYLFQPEHPGAIPASSRGGSESMRAGGVYDLDPEWAQMVAEGCPGVGGASCLIPVDVPVSLPQPVDVAVTPSGRSAKGMRKKPAP